MKYVHKVLAHPFSAKRQSENLQIQLDPTASTSSGVTQFRVGSALAMPGNAIQFFDALTLYGEYFTRPLVDGRRNNAPNAARVDEFTYYRGFLTRHMSVYGWEVDELLKTINRDRMGALVPRCRTSPPPRMLYRRLYLRFVWTAQSKTRSRMSRCPACSPAVIHAGSTATKARNHASSARTTAATASGSARESVLNSAADGFDIEDL
jgi:hypothetical protein